MGNHNSNFLSTNLSKSFFHGVVVIYKYGRGICGCEFECIDILQWANPNLSIDLGKNFIHDSMNVYFLAGNLR